MGDIVTVDHNDLLKNLAWEVSKNVVDHHKFVYAKIFKNAPSTFPISLRNAIYNEIQSAIKCRTDNDIREWIVRSKQHRKEMRRLRRANRETENG